MEFNNNGNYRCMCSFFSFLSPQKINKHAVNDKEWEKISGMQWDFT